MPSAFHRFHMVTVISALALLLMASRCSDDDESDTSAADPAPEVEPDPVMEPDAQPTPDEGGEEILGTDAVEPDPGLGIDGIELDGPVAPHEGDGSTPDDPSFEPSDPEPEPDPEDY